MSTVLVKQADTVYAPILFSLLELHAGLVSFADLQVLTEIRALKPHLPANTTHPSNQRALSSVLYFFRS